MPGQEVPASVLALFPISFNVAAAWHRIARAQIAELPPQILVNPDGRVEPPSCRLAKSPPLHCLYAARIPKDRGSPVAAEFPDILASVGHSSFQAAQRKNDTVANTICGMLLTENVLWHFPSASNEYSLRPARQLRGYHCPSTALRIEDKSGAVAVVRRDVGFGKRAIANGQHAFSDRRSN